MRFPRSRLPRSADELVDEGLPRQLTGRHPQARDCRVVFDGEDVTDMCWQACADAGVVAMWVDSEDGMNLEKRFLTGKVEIRRA